MSLNKMKMCDIHGLIYKRICPHCDSKIYEKQLKENYLSTRSELLDITGNSIKMLKALTKFEEASNALHRFIIDKN